MVEQQFISLQQIVEVLSACVMHRLMQSAKFGLSLLQLSYKNLMVSIWRWNAVMHISDIIMNLINK